MSAERHFWRKRDIRVAKETLFEEKRHLCWRRNTFREKETSVKGQFWRNETELSLDFAVQLKWKRVNSV